MREDVVPPEKQAEILRWCAEHALPETDSGDSSPHKSSQAASEAPSRRSSEDRRPVSRDDC